MTDKWDQQYQTGEGLRYWPESELVRFIGRTYGATHGRGQIDSDMYALDLGCGTGRNSWLLYEAGFQVYSCDGSAEAIAVAVDYIKSRYPVIEPGIYLERNDVLTQLQLENDEMHDLIIDCQTIQHLSDEDHVKAYQEIARVLKSGGHFWSMHVKEGDVDQVYAGQYPELVTRNVEQMSALIGPGMKGITIDLCMRTYGQCKQRIFWYLMEWVKP